MRRRGRRQARCKRHVWRLSSAGIQLVEKEPSRLQPEATADFGGAERLSRPLASPAISSAGCGGATDAKLGGGTLGDASR